ncbi:hypothetical protein ACH4PU_20080 [Streptomyces sp. NPDC021100]|uniref:hypothetical protein n=1 Tax=Streptomyces sp. NPDC021100 TaxID=3365114 RepID=UPI00378DFF67
MTRADEPRHPTDAAPAAADFRAAAELGVHAVPLFLFEDGSAVSGAQSPDALLAALRRVPAGR